MTYSAEQLTLPETMAHLTARYRIGQPLAVYAVHARVRRALHREMRLSTGAMISSALLALAACLYAVAIMGVKMLPLLILLLQHPAGGGDSILLPESLQGWRLPVIVGGALLGCVLSLGNMWKRVLLLNAMR